MKLTKKKAYKLHYEMWDWLYHNPSKRKKDWPQWEYLGRDIDMVANSCFLCEWVDINCDRCPLCINDKDCNIDNSRYKKWWRAKTAKTRKKYAKFIRDVVL